MKSLKRVEIASTRWADIAKQLPIAVTSDGEIVAYLIKENPEKLLDISDFPPLMKQRIESTVELVNAAR